MWDGKYMRGNTQTRHYSYVGEISTRQRGGGNDPNTGVSGGWGQSGRSLAEIDESANTIALCEIRGYNGPDPGPKVEGSAGDTRYASPWGSLFIGCDTYKLAGRKKGQDPAPPPGCEGHFSQNDGIKGHMGMGEYIFLDGHVKAMTWNQVRQNDFRVFKRRKPIATFTP
jgi:hypothetical protein